MNPWVNCLDCDSVVLRSTGSELCTVLLIIMNLVALWNIFFSSDITLLTTTGRHNCLGSSYVCYLVHCILLS